MHPEWRARLKPTSAPPPQESTTDVIEVLGKRRYTILVSSFKREARGEERVQSFLLEYMLRSNGFSPSKAEIAQFEELIQHGGFTLDQFVTFAIKCESVSKDSYALSELMHFFKPFDTDNTGMISEHVFRRVMLDCGERFSDDELEAVMGAFKSEDNMGFIDYRSFLTTYVEFMHHSIISNPGSRAINTSEMNIIFVCSLLYEE